MSIARDMGERHLEGQKTSLERRLTERLRRRDDEIERLRAAVFAIEVHCASSETHDPVIERICRDVLAAPEGSR